MPEIVTIKIQRLETRLATTLINSGDDMHPLAIIQAVGELSGIILKQYMEDVTDETGRLAELEALGKRSELLLKQHMEEVLDKNGLEIKKPKEAAQS